MEAIVDSGMFIFAIAIVILVTVISILVARWRDARKTENLNSSSRGMRRHRH
jgi:uncharacterized membrane protein YhaH (DUF805 family)